MAGIADVRGLWRRTLYRRGDDPPDCSAEVFWLQGPAFFADIRQPMQRMSFAGVNCLRALGADHLAWLAAQQAFAGRLELEGTRAWWRRSIDLQPQSPFADRARLEQSGDILDEYGTEAYYTERWERENPPNPCWGLRLARVRDGRDGFLIRAADRLIFARARTSPVPLRPGTLLGDALCTLPLESQQDLLDLEVSLGSVRAATPGQPQEWLIERSTLPYKQGRAWSLRLHADAPADPAGVIELADLDPQGNCLTDSWRIVETDAAGAPVSSSGGLGPT
ncbi:MAG: hypothetical protein M3N97_04125 [Pseudomonadota bacterium]|nr:hypothetical protein [Pseudomonadota bacterium]